MSKRLPNKKDVISASEIAQYAYCSVSWYLQRCGYHSDSPNLEKETGTHGEVGEKIDLVQTKEREARQLSYHSDSPNLEKGTRMHDEVGEKIDLVQTKERKARQLSCLGYLLLATVALFLLWWLL